MNENDISRLIYDSCFYIHKSLGPGLFESVYEDVLHYELQKTGLLVERQKALPVIWEERKMESGFRADLIIENKVIIEIKSVEALNPIHYKQVATYLRLSACKLGILANFNSYLIKDGLKRVLNRLADDQFISNKKSITS